MATGRVDVLRRGSLSNPRKEFEYHENCVRGAKARFFQHRDFEHKNGYQLSVGAPNSGFRQNVLYGKIEERGFGGMSNADKSHVKDCESSDFEDAVGLPPEKKRKFSPIIWDREEKEVKISSKNRVVPVAPLSPPQQSPTTSVDQVLEVVSDGEVSELLVLESGNQFQEKSELSIAESAVTDGLVGISQSKDSDDLSPPLLAEQQDQISVQMEEEELVQARNISTSRWASDIDSPRDVSDDECGIDKQNTSPESEEFRREDSVGGRKRTFSSDEEGLFLGSGSGDKYCERELTGDEQDCENAGIDRVESDIEYHDLYPMEEPTVSNRRQFNMLQGCRSVFEYEKLNKINEGTYGVVYKAKDKKTGEIVALKKVKMNIDRDGDGFPLSSLREINILLSFSHPSVVNVKEVVMGDLDSIFMVMEYMEYDLKGLMEVMKKPFSISEVKWLMLQLLEGVEYLHENWVLHRDLKTSNILLSKEGELKICDFGLSRQYGSPLKPYTPLVVTLWYRAPEILLGTKQYSTAIDMWSVGCIMAEMVAKEALFRGKTEVDQLDKIFKTLGTPNETVWPGFSKLPGAKAKFVKQPYNLLRKKFPAASFTGSPVLSDLGFDLLSRLLSYDPEKRITAKDALNHDWFREAPFPKSGFKPTFPELHGQKRYLNSRQHEKFLQR